MTQAATETTVVRPDLPEFAATVEPMHDYGTRTDGFVIRKADGAIHTVTTRYATGYMFFGEREDAEAFIQNGGLIEVTIVDPQEVTAASGWVEADGHCEANYARFQAYCRQEGIHCYSAEKQDFFEFIGVQQAQRLGLRKLYLENLS